MEAVFCSVSHGLVDTGEGISFTDGSERRGGGMGESGEKSVDRRVTLEVSDANEPMALGCCKRMNTS